MGIPPAPRGVPQIEVTFAIDSNGIVNVSARDMATNLSQSIQINPAGGLSEAEVQRLVAEADRNSQADLERREIRQLKNRLEGLIYSNERVFGQFRDMLQDDRRPADPRVSDARAPWRSTTSKRADLEAAIYDLNTVSRTLSDVMLTRASGWRGARRKG